MKLTKPKFAVQKKLMDFTSKIDVVIKDTICLRHGADEGEPCYYIPTDAGASRLAVCGDRAFKIYVGQTSERALSGRRPQKEFK